MKCEIKLRFSFRSLGKIDSPQAELHHAAALFQRSSKTTVRPIYDIPQSSSAPTNNVAAISMAWVRHPGVGPLRVDEHS
jgi:hypothetical protein